MIAETGYCGFGDTCKFLHDRGTCKYHSNKAITRLIITSDLAGWQLDKLAETAKRQVEESASDSDSSEDIPFACLICRKHFTEPVVTRCGHYYCSSCAIKRYARNPKCLACGAPTAGIFNRADRILAKIHKKRGENDEHEDHDDRKDSVRIEGLADDGADVNNVDVDGSSGDSD